MKARFKLMFFNFIQSPLKIALFFSFLVFFPFPEFSENLIFEPLSDAVHLLLGFSIFYFVKTFGLKYTTFGKVKDFFPVATLLVSIGLGGYIEYIQPYLGRGYSLHDMELSLFGSFCAFFWFEKSVPNNRFYFVISFILGLSIAVIPVFDGFRLANQKWSQFPVLVKSNSILNRIIKPVFDVELEYEVGPCAVLFKTSSLFGGISIPRGREDWSKFDELSIEFDSLSDSAREIGIRVDDAIQSKNYQDRYNGRFVTQPGLNKIVVNISDMKDSVQKREFNLNKIRRIFLFSVDDKNDISVCLRRIELKNRSR